LNEEGGKMLTEKEFLAAARGYKSWLFEGPATEVLYDIRSMADGECSCPSEAGCRERIREIVAFAQKFLDTGKVPPDDEGGVT
jgi:hypothetical protein